MIYIIVNIFFLLSAASPTQDFISILNNYRIKDTDPERIELNKGLSEISGLASTADGRVFAHNDEKGIIYEIDPDNGKIVKRFFLGRWVAEEDFEGIAVAGKKIYLISSDGTLFEFEEGEDEKPVDYKIHKTGASAKFDVEGLCYDPDTNSLLFACKEYPGKGYKGFRAVYSYSLDTYKVNTTPRFLVSIEKVTGKIKTKDFHPSGIERHPVSGNFFLIGTKNGNAIVELSSKGELLDVGKLKGKYHKQPEGITFLPDLTLLISDERVKKHAYITKYSYTE